MYVPGISLHDFIHSTAAVVAPSGAVDERCDYGPYGFPTVWSADYGGTRGSTAVHLHFLFTGQAYDAETGLHHYKARVHHSVLGRFLQRDPARDDHHSNSHEYVASSPATQVDPSGEQTNGSIAAPRGRQFKYVLSNAVCDLCTENEVQAITAALGNALRRISVAQVETAHLANNEPNTAAAPALSYLLASRQSDFNTLKDHLYYFDDRLYSADPLWLACSKGGAYNCGSWNAKTWTGTGNTWGPGGVFVHKIVFCPGFFTQGPWEETKELIHELSHRYRETWDGGVYFSNWNQEYFLPPAVPGGAQVWLGRYVPSSWGWGFSAYAYHADTLAEFIMNFW